jgi:hypothetical protein
MKPPAKVNLHHSDGAKRVLAPVQIAVKPISQTRCQPGDNIEKNDNKERNRT